jgi:VacB/RNase II family 3'-5' exoribonuclease
MSASVDLQSAARQELIANGFEPEFSAAAQAQMAQIQAHPPQVAAAAGIRDLRGLLWSSIDNDTSRDLDQIEVAEAAPNGAVKIMVGIADVDAFVPKGTPIDQHAAAQTATLYAGVHIFPMLPEALSTGATSLLEGGDKLALVIESVVAPDGSVTSSDIYRAVVRNKAQLAYDGVGAWLEGRGPAPAKVAASADLQAQLKLQDQVAQVLCKARHEHGALNIETIEIKPVMDGERVVDVARQEKSRATELIEDFMIASNGVVARYFEAHKRSSLRRVVRTPKRWPRIVDLAKSMGTTLPGEPDPKALNDFLTARKAADPDHFADLSLAVVKLMGPGEYVLERPGDPETGHFGLAVQDYTHSTAPNRRFADLVSQRLLKATLANQPPPYSDDELQAIAAACTLKENAAQKVERNMTKRIAAVAMAHRVGQTFDAIVTGAGDKGTFVRVLTPNVEGMLVRGQQGADVGDRIRVRLVHTDPQKGFIDFERA